MTLALWRGDAYGEFGDAGFAVGEVARLTELKWAAMEDIAEAQLEGGSFEVVTADVERVVVDQPGRERAWGLLIRALYPAGRQRDALAAYQRAHRALAEEFGLEPGHELRALERRVLEQDPALTVRRAPLVPAALRRDVNPFTGRVRELAWLMDSWRATRAGTGQWRLLLGSVESGRTRLAAELAAVAIADGGQVMHVRGDEGFERPNRRGGDRVTTRGRCRSCRGSQSDCAAARRRGRRRIVVCAHRDVDRRVGSVARARARDAARDRRLHSGFGCGGGAEPARSGRVADAESGSDG